MNLSNLKIMLGAMIFIASVLCASADSPQGPPNSDRGIILISRNKGKYGKPNAPSRDVIICHCNENELVFELPQSIYSMTVTIINTEYVFWTGLISRDNNVAEITLPSGEWVINCVAEDGRLFSAEISIPANE